MTRLADKAVLLVGAGSVGPGWSNGKASAVSYAREGAAVVCVDHILGRAEETAQIITDEGGRAIALRADATSEHDVQMAVDRTIAEYGKLDVLHNNVGVGGTTGAPDSISPEDWHREIDLTLNSAYLGTRCAVPAIRQSGGGSILNISSTMAIRFFRRPSVAYAAAKAAVEAMTNACSVAYGRDNIRVNCIRIGLSETPIVEMALKSRNLGEDREAAEMAKSRAKVPLRGEHGDPFDIAAAAVFLASDEAKYISGVVLNVDGSLANAPM